MPKNLDLFDEPTAPAKPAKALRLPEYRVSVVRDGSVDVEGAEALDSPDIVARAMRQIINGDEREFFVLFMLDSRNRLKRYSIISIGTLTASLVHPREVFRPAIVSGAAAVIVSHNHPSDEVRPSPEDKDTTRRLAKAGEILGMPVLDHVIVTSDTHMSFRQEGLI